MYIPKGFEVEDLPTLHAFMTRNSFATLVGTLDGSYIATHIPLHIDRSRGPKGTILGHMARANPHGKILDGKSPAMAIFTGPHAYVSPSWYESEQKVPTWLYTAVHAYGMPRPLRDPAALRAHLTHLVDTYEGGLVPPWKLSSQGETYLQGMQRGIVAFEMEIERIEGKFKLNQTKSEADRLGTIAGLQASDDPMAQEVAAMMLEREA